MINFVNQVIDNSDSLLLVNLPQINYIEKSREKISLIGTFNPSVNKQKIDLLLKKKINIFSLDLLPRITRAQSMDVLSSQANLAGYKVPKSVFFVEDLPHSANGKIQKSKLNADYGQNSKAG